MGTGAELFGSVYENGELIFRQGDPGDTMFIVQSGAVKISQLEAGKEVVIAVLEKGALFGEMALLHRGPRSATAKAAGQTRLLALTPHALIERVRLDPGVALHLLKALTFKIYRADQRLQQIVEQKESEQEASEVSGETLEQDNGPAAVAAAREEPASENAAGLSFSELSKSWAMEENSSLTIEQGQRVFSEGDVGDALYIILEGEVEISRGEGGAKQLFTRLGQGGLFGELALIVDTLRSADAIALTRTRVMTVGRDEFLKRIAVNPELALFILTSLIERLRQKEQSLADPKRATDVVQKSWISVFKKRERVRMAIVSLSTCAGCSAVLLDDQVLAQVLAHVNIAYCPMLMDQVELPEVDVALVDGAVRLKDDVEMLEEARAKSRFLVAWGTCAAFGGIPAEANRYELEELIERTYGHAEDAFAHYLSGKGGVGQATYRESGVELLRKACKLDDFARVDYYVPGCPPQPGYLLQLVGELTGNEFQKAKALVCAECGRKVGKSDVVSLRSFPEKMAEKDCFHSQGVLCAGFMTRGGCGAVCTRNGCPCWGCRGPAQTALTRMTEGDSFEEVMTGNLGRRCKMEEQMLKPITKQLRRRSHTLFDFDPNSLNSLRRIR
jgi:F420-non-reducing hydrogenase small subunit